MKYLLNILSLAGVVVTSVSIHQAAAAGAVVPRPIARPVMAYSLAEDVDLVGRPQAALRSGVPVHSADDIILGFIDSVMVRDLMLHALVLLVADFSAGGPLLLPATALEARAGKLVLADPALWQQMSAATTGD